MYRVIGNSHLVPRVTETLSCSQADQFPLAMTSGDACLPGGSKDSGDASFVDTALREASEEVGLDRRQVEVVCSLPQQRTGGRVGLTVVTPVVALTRCTPEELGLSPNPAEVDCLYWVPLELFLTLQLGSDGQTSAWWYKAVFRFIDPETELMHVIYGLTSYICVSIAAIALNRRPNFTYLAHFISRVAKQGEMIASVHNTIALTRQEAEEIQLSKL